MDKDKLYTIASDAVNDAELTSAEIPAIDLYVDQIINLISDKLSEGSERYHSKQLTKTMINNYSKDGIIMPVKGKKYTKEQIIQILFVYSLKNSLSIGEIKRLLWGAYESEGFDASRLIALYDKHESIKESGKDTSKAILEGIINENQLSPDNDDDYISTVCALLSLSTQLRSMAQAMIDEKFPEPTENEPEEKDSKKDKEKSKKDKEKDKEKSKKPKESKKKKKTEETA